MNRVIGKLTRDERQHSAKVVRVLSGVAADTKVDGPVGGCRGLESPAAVGSSEIAADREVCARDRKPKRELLLALALPLFWVLAQGCGGTPAKSQNREFFTSGSKEADQRASQRMAKAEQLTGSGEGAGGEKGVKKATKATGVEQTEPGQTNKPAQAEGKLALYDRLGGEAGISNIVVDFTPRVLDDPRVNWDRKGVTRGGFSLHHSQSVTWKATAANVATLERHLIQFIALATGGPAQYDGKEMRATHANMHIANDEFDAAVGDLKASLDKLQVPNKEQKELLSIIESTRPEIVEER